MMRLRPTLWIVLLGAALAAPGGAVRAQVQPDDVTQPAGEVASDFAARRKAMLSLIRRAQKAMQQKDYEAAEAHLNRASDIVNAGGFAGTVDFYQPSLNFARLFYRQKKWDLVARFAGFAAAGMGQAPLKATKERVIAEGYFAEALIKLKRDSEAEAVYESALSGLAVFEGDDGRQRFAASILYETAKLKSRLKRAEAAELRERVFALYLSDGKIWDREYAYLRYQDISARRAATGLSERGVLLAPARQFLGFLDRDGVKVQSADQLTYRAFLCKVFAETKARETALGLCEEVDGAYADAEKFGRAYYRNAHSLVSTLILMKRYDDAKTRIDAYSERARRDGYAGWHELANLHSARGFLLRRRGETSAAQQNYRTAYFMFRKIYPANHPRVLRERRKIDTEDAGFGGFLLAHEFGGNGGNGTAFAPDPRGDGAVMWVFSGQGVELDSALAAATKEESAALWLNRAAAAALLGRFDEVETTLAQARRLARRGNADIAANSPWFDLVEGVARLWSTDHTRAKARGVLDRLSRREDLDATAAGMLDVLKLLHLSAQGKDALRRQATRQMAAQWQAAPEPNGWDLFAAITLWGFAQDVLDPDPLAQLGARISALIERPGSANVAQMLFEYQPFAMGTSEVLSLSGLARMEALVHQLQQAFPERHIIQTVVLSQYSAVLRRLGRLGEAANVAEAAAGSYRDLPYHQTNELSFLISQQANIAFEQWLSEGDAKQADIAVSLARTAYDMMDQDKARWDLSLDVTITYMRVLNNWGEHSAADRIAKRHAPDINDLPPGSYHRAILFLVEQAEIAVALGQIEAARAAFVRAVSMIPDKTLVDQDFRAGIEYNRGIFEWNEGDLGLGFGLVAQSNTIFQRVSAERARRATTGQIIDDGQGRRRVADEAFMGWEYALALSGEDQQ